AFLIGSFLNIVYLRKLTGISYEKGRMLKISLVTVLMALAVQFSYTTLVAADIRSHLATLMAISLGVLLYGILLFLIRELDINMLKRLSGGR
ncbi:polysaccharide biosynthesis C-terminal domain-containing protein, partial [Syntrophomonas wolfei]